MADFGFASWLQSGQQPSPSTPPTAPPPSAPLPVKKVPPSAPPVTIKAEPSSSGITASASKIAGAFAASLTNPAGTSSKSFEGVGQPAGVVLRPGSDELDTDSIPAGDLQQLMVSPITRVKTELRADSCNTLTQIASNGAYIVYGLKGGHIRVLHKDTGTLALFKGHTSMIADMRFFSATNSMLATCDTAGAVHVRSISRDSVNDAPVLEDVLVRHTLHMHECATRRLAWHPQLENLLAVATHQRVAFINVPPTSGVAVSPEFAEPLLPKGPQTAAALTCLAFSPRGDALVAGDSGGNVFVWLLPKDLGEQLRALPTEPSMCFVAHPAPLPPHVAISLAFLPGAAQGMATLATGGEACRQFKLWSLNLQGGEQVGSRCTYTLALSSHEAPGSVVNHMVGHPVFGLLVVANVLKKQVHVLHIHHDPATHDPSFRFISTFSVLQPILSMAADLEETYQDPNGVDMFRLYTVQADAVQEYTLYPRNCYPAVDVDEDHLIQKQIFEESHTRVTDVQPVIAPQLHTALTTPLWPEQALGSAGSASSPPVARDSSPPPPPPSTILRAAGRLSSAEQALPALHALHGELLLPPRLVNMSDLTSQAALTSAALAAPSLAALAPAGFPSTFDSQPFHIPVAHIPATFAPPAAAGHTSGAAPASVSPATAAVAHASVDATLASLAAAAVVNPFEAVFPFGAGSSAAGGARVPLLGLGLAGLQAGPAPLGLAGLPIGLPAVRRIMQLGGTDGPSTPPELAEGGEVQPTATQITTFRLPRTGSDNSLASDAGSQPVPPVAPAAPTPRRPQQVLRRVSATGTHVAETPRSTGSRGGESRDLGGESPAVSHSGVVPSRPVVSGDGGGVDRREGGPRPRENEGFGESPGPAVRPGAGPVGHLEEGSAHTGKRPRTRQPALAAPVPPPAPSVKLLQRGTSHGGLQTLTSLESAATQDVARPDESTAPPANQALTLVAEQLVAQMKALRVELKAELKAEFKAELKAANRANEQATARAVESAVKSALESAKAKEEVSRAVGQAVAMASKDLSAKLDQLQRSLPAQVAQAAVPVVQTAVTQALPAAAQQAVDRAVGGAVRAALPGALGDALRDSFAAGIVPAFERATQTMFGQIQAAMKMGLAEHQQAMATATAEAALSLGELRKMSEALKDNVTALEIITSGLAAAGTASVPPPQTAPQAARDLKQAVTEALDAGQYNSAFDAVLTSNRGDLLSWLLAQVAPQQVLADPCQLAQGVLLSLLSHLTMDLQNDTAIKLRWIEEAAPSLDPRHPETAPHVKVVLEPLKHALHAVSNSATGEPAKRARTAMLLVNSVLHM